MTEEKKCYSCKYSDCPFGHRGQLYNHVARDCRKRSPKVFKNSQNGIVTEFPQVLGDEWCGDWEKHE